MKKYLLLGLAIGTVLAGCQTMPGSEPSEPTRGVAAQGVPRPADNIQDATGENVARNFAALGRSRQEVADHWQNRSFEEFERQVAREAGTGNYVVNGDIVISDRKRLQEFFEKEVKTPQETTRLIVHAPGGVKAVWNNSQKRNLTYCVSNTFGANKSRVVADMAAATDAWEQQGDVDFVYSSIQDSNCNAINAQVVFDVRPVTGQSYLARAFFPDNSRGNRNVLINDSSFEPSSGNLTLEGILRHELGHTLGFRHEHTRPESGTCFEDSSWVPLTTYDAFSVMHYPQCNGQGDWSLTLTDFDKLGICKQYGAGPGFTGNSSSCATAPPPPPNSGCGPQTVTESGNVARREMVRFGPYAVTAGTEFNVTMTGSGDPDLYVEFTVEPTLTAYRCRPYLTGANEECRLMVPQNTATAHVMVNGYAAGSYELEIEHTPNQ